MWLTLAVRPALAEDTDDDGADEMEEDATAAGGRAPASAASKAAPKVAAASNGVTILQLDPKFPVGRLRKAGYRVRTYASINREDPWRDPSVQLRDDLFSSVGLQKSTKDWDHLAKDLLFLRAQDQSLERLAGNYPKIPRALLARLQKTIRRAKGAER